METLVQLSDVTKRYGSRSTEPALHQVSLRIPAGRVTAIMGPSGSGKSTLLNLVAGLDRPTSGVVTLDGIELSRLGEAALARYRRVKIGLIFQFFNLLNNLTALDNVLIPAELAGMPRRHALERGHELLDQLGIADQARKYPAQLSGGERQRVAVARAIINRPVLLLADEPTGALDTHSGEQVMDLLADLNRGGQTILLVTHDHRVAQKYASAVIRLVDGQVTDDSSSAIRVAVQ
ncbi:MAG: ABC transporter ATP-binding protein [Chloroflexi bacterium]|nr:MAG: ABC transporter ATP-binding protein [Chloroflexota bacterium]TME46800.1 MAG: ABC transporter ATP-binding protein [Chloroflexota bacterium]